MVKAEDLPPISNFSYEFALLLSGLVEDAGISRQEIATLMGRSRAYVSDQLLGKRAVDTDVIAAIAESIGATPRLVVQQVLDHMPPDLFGIPGINEEFDREVTGIARKYAELLRRREQARAVEENEEEDAYDEPLAAHDSPTTIAEEQEASDDA